MSRTLSNSDYEQLLGRPLLRPDLEPLRPNFAGSAVLVTGAAGSIGAELCSQLLQLDPARLVCIDRDETALFELEHRLSPRRASVQYCVADMADTARMQSLLQEHSIDSVFHAAAYKHVSLMERDPAAALSNNVFALARLLDAAEQSGVRSFLLISSDKAVNPVSVMGCTKRFGELLLSARPAGAMRSMSVRFGNVLDSQGSVLPIFRRQLDRCDPLTVTHPEATRFFMTLSEAASLLLHAFAIGESGDVLVLKTGEPISVLRLAEALVQIYGPPAAATSIVFTGLRPGEKLHEELFYETEETLPTSCPQIVRVPSTHAHSIPPTELHGLELQLSCASPSELKQALAALVPEYRIEPEYNLAVRPR